MAMHVRLAAAAALMTTTVALCALPASTARANGDTAHVWIALRAVEHLPDGELRRLLERPELRTMLVNGSVFPDGGYVVGDDFGEQAHWEPFLDAYVRWVRETMDRPLTDGVAAEHVAFLMGVAAHGMADEVFDAMFMIAAQGYDASGWSDNLLDSLDTAADVMLVDQTGMEEITEEPWVPAEDLSAIFADSLGYTVAPGTLVTAQDLVHRITLTFVASAAGDPAQIAEYYERYPWSGDNLLDDTEPGAPPCEAEVVAAYWLALWDRLHEASSEQNVVIATYPRDGAAGHPTDRSRAEAQVVIVLGHGVETAQLQDDVEVRDDTGKVYEIEVTSPWGTALTNLVRILPQEDWAEDRDFTVTLAPGFTAIDGFAPAAPFSFGFSTAPAPPSDPTSDPTPHTGEPDVGRPPPESGGCAAGGQPGGGLALVAAALLVAGRRKRHRFM
jgi:MYXO-CTERM domain-containing protein